MSSLKVPLVSIKTVEPHTNADRLEVATIEGWSCIVPKGIHAPGDRVIYIPIDSILSKEIEDYLFPEDSKIKLSKSRVRTIRLRGLLSQGIIVELSEELICTFPKLFGRALGDDVADVLGITKYEPPLSSIPGAMRGQKSKKQNPYFKEYTELENIKWYQDVFEPDEPIYVTEKCHGTSTRYAWAPIDPKNRFHKLLQDLKLQPSYEWVYGSHKRQLQDTVLIENKTIQRILRQFVDYLPRFLRKRVYRGFYEEDVYAIIAKQEKLRHKLKPGEALYGEICGAKIQGEKYSYGNPIESYSLHVFDVMKDGKYLDAFEFRKFCYQRDIPTVPEDLDIGYFNLDVLTKAANEESHFHMAGQKIKEGIVIRPIKERYDNRCGRVILKMINPEYLLDFNNQDFH